MDRRVTYSTTLGIGLVLVAACRDDDVVVEPDAPVAQFESVCGREGPRLLLELAEGQYAYRLDLLQDSERLLLSIFEIDPGVPLAQGSPTQGRAIYTVGPCGDLPVELARDLVVTRTYQQHVLACGEDSRDLYELDPQGNQPPRLVMEGVCPAVHTDQGLLTVATDNATTTGPLLLAQPTADGWAVQTLQPDVYPPLNAFFGGAGSTTLTPVWSAAGEALVLDAAGQVLRLDLVTGQSEVELKDVLHFRVSGDGTWMVWQAASSSEGDVDALTGPVFLRHRSDATEQHLLNTHLAWSGTVFQAGYVVLRDDSAAGLRIFGTDGGELVLPEDTVLRAIRGTDQIWLARSEGTQTQELMWTPSTAELTLIFGHQGGLVWGRSDRIDLFFADDAPGPDEGSLYAAPYTGGQPQLVAQPIHASYRDLPDGRLLTAVGEDEDRMGQLRLVVPGTREYVVVDEQVYVRSPELNAGDPLDGDLVYMAAGAGGDARRGVYRARVR